MLPELAFVLAPRQNLFFHELVGALRDEADKANIRTSLHVGNFPRPRPDLIYVMVPPHEYFTLMHGRYGPLPEVLKRTIFICAEQPNTPFFESKPGLGAPWRRRVRHKSLCRSRLRSAWHRRRAPPAWLDGAMGSPTRA